MIKGSIGFTGTREMISSQQEEKLQKLLAHFKSNYTDFHHGDCVGADEKAFEIAKELGYLTIAHPNIDGKHRAYTKSDVILRAKPPIIRNHDIVKASEIMLATPNTEQEILRSGTWATIRYCNVVVRPLYIIFPDGLIEFRGPGDNRIG